jgi:hypothetical protein
MGSLGGNNIKHEEVLIPPLVKLTSKTMLKILGIFN